MDIQELQKIKEEDEAKIKELTEKIAEIKKESVEAVMAATLENAKNLFYQKYERGRGIRLLGVGFHNIQNGIDDPQGELFDFGEKKKQEIIEIVEKYNIPKENIFNLTP